MLQNNSTSLKNLRALITSPLGLTTIVLTAFVLAASCFLLLSTRTVCKLVETSPFTTERQPYLLQSSGPRSFSTPLTLSLPAPWSRVRSIILPITLSKSMLPLDTATLSLEGTLCQFKSHQSVLRDDGNLVLDTSSCNEELDADTTYNATLTIALNAPGTIGLVAPKTPNEQPHTIGLPPLTGTQTTSPLGCFVTRPTPDTIRLVDQIAAIWTLPSLKWIAPLTAGCAIALFCLGGLVLCTTYRQRNAIAAGALSLALSISYAVLVPPFQAPDEPDHFLAVAKVLDTPELAQSARDLARYSHFERIHFHPNARFLPEHMDAPYPMPWKPASMEGYHVSESGMEQRSALTTIYWKLLGPLLRKMDAANALLCLRLLNGVLWSLACALGALLIGALAPSGRRLFPLFLFVVPTLPFFAMHVSNYAFYMQGLTVAGSLSLGLFLRGRRCEWSGILIGLTGAFMLLASTNGATMFAWIAFMAAGRLLIAAGDRSDSVGAAATYWIGLLAGFSPLLLFPDSPELKFIGQAMVKVGGGMGMPQSLAGELNDPTVLIIICVVIAAVCIAIEYGISRGGAWMRKAADTAAIWAAGLAAAFLAALLLHTAFQLYTSVPNVISSIGIREYMDIAIRGLFSLLTFRQPDIMLSQTFWSGFGWHDCFFASWVVRLLAGVSGIGLLAALVSVLSQPSRAIRLLCTIAGALLAGILIIVMISIGVRGNIPNVHGRYLTGVYMLLLSVAWAGFSPAIWTGRQPAPHIPTLQSRRLRTALELLITWSALAAGGFCLYMAGWTWIFPTLPVPLLVPYAAFTLLAPVICAGILALWARSFAGPGWTIRDIAPRPAYILALAACIFSALVAAELLVGLPKAAVYNPGFYVVLPSAITAALLLWLAPPSIAMLRRWTKPTALAFGAIIHVASLYLLVLRYFG
ncbi:hypothetical protein [Oceanidesulfovibrio marinus]|uniref:DUF2142 domain-containing protein n=1 Tax=Oceanidesulfovibrio marinus TaxID=370038 RepID=A0A6P1ZKP5_9BACT|nr:hypothetical protein [Oceanidesulfovibrio marinus]TVM36521.1 hypothetical protein DQK91_00935 [Oceanidesulfovibrio marinus]